MFHPLVSTIKNLLEEHSLWYDYMEHEPVRTSEEAAKIRPDKYTIENGAKALIVRIKRSESDKSFAMLVVPGHSKFDIKKARNILQAKDIRFATPEEINIITNGVEIGGIPPFGNLFDIRVYCDPNVLINENMIFNAGDRSVSIAIKTSDYKKLVSPQIVELI